jgi:hypothetical protein
MNSIRLLLFFAVFALTSSAQAMNPPSSYGYGNCKVIADELKAEFGGTLVFLQPNTYPEPIGHWINRLYINGKYYYIDYGEQRIFTDRQSVLDWYIDAGRESKIFETAIMVEENKK